MRKIRVVHFALVLVALFAPASWAGDIVGTVGVAKPDQAVVCLDTAPEIRPPEVRDVSLIRCRVHGCFCGHRWRGTCKSAAAVAS